MIGAEVEVEEVLELQLDLIASPKGVMACSLTSPDHLLGTLGN
jgi:hypothetical protein